MEASTTVLLPDGKGTIVGSLIKETNNYKEWWVRVLDKTPVIGTLFSRSNVDIKRVEVIVVITTHIVPFSEKVDARECELFSRSTLSTPIENHCTSPWQQRSGQVISPNYMRRIGQRPELVHHANARALPIRPQYLPPVQQPKSGYQLRD